MGGRIRVATCSTANRLSARGQARCAGQRARPGRVAERPEICPPPSWKRFNYGDRVLLEAFVPGAELSVGVIGSSEPKLCRPSRSGRRPSVRHPCARESRAVDFLCPASVRRARLKWRSISARDAARVPRRAGLRPRRHPLRRGWPVVLDVKTCPGLTETSIVPLAAKEARMQFEDFCRTRPRRALARAAPAGV